MYIRDRYESIQHLMNSAAKIFVTGVRSSAYHWHYDYEFIAVLKGRIEVLYGLYGPEPVSYTHLPEQAFLHFRYYIGI